jgi:hypothetical protein
MNLAKQPVKDTTNFDGLADLLKTPAKSKVATGTGTPQPKSTPRRKSISGELTACWLESDD